MLGDRRPQLVLERHAPIVPSFCRNPVSRWPTTRSEVIGLPGLVLHFARSDERGRLCHAASAELEQLQFLLGHVSIPTSHRYLGCKQRQQSASNDRIATEPAD